jgi:hypothetical protein
VKGAVKLSFGRYQSHGAPSNDFLTVPKNLRLCWTRFGMSLPAFGTKIAFVLKDFGLP